MAPFPYWLGLGFTIPLLVQLVGVVVGTEEGDHSLWQNLAITVQSSAPITLVGLSVAVLGQRTAVQRWHNRSMGRPPTAWLNALLAVLLAASLVMSAVVFETELRADVTRQQQAMDKHIASLQQELEQVQSPDFRVQLQEPDALANIRAGLPSQAGLPANAGVDEVVAALEELIRNDLEQLGSDPSGSGSMLDRRQWGARLFEEAPVLVLASIAILLAVEALR